jgi:hypothetical protein
LINFARIIGLLGVLIALAGCSTIKLGYNNLADVGYWWLDGYIDFEDAQTPRARDDLARLHAWHRGTELPRLAELLQRAERLAAGEVTPEQLCAFVPPLRERLSVAGEQAEPAIASLALSLTAAQLQHLERKYERNNTEFRKKWLQVSPTDVREKRAEQITERAENLYGTLSDAQRAALQQQLQRSTYRPQGTLAERQRRQQDTLATLRKLAGQSVAPEQARAQVRGLIERLVTPPDAEQRARQEVLAQESCRTLAAVHNAATPAQRDRAGKRLRAYQQDLQELVANP